jgi:hypothetical protein
MKLSQFSVEPLANHLAVPHHHSSDERIGAHSPSPALGKLQRTLEMLAIRACELGFHETD